MLRVGWVNTLPQGLIVALCVWTGDAVSNKRENTALRNTEQRPNRNSDGPKEHQQKSPSPVHSQRDIEIIRKVFAACDER